MCFRQHRRLRLLGHRHHFLRYAEVTDASLLVLNALHKQNGLSLGDLASAVRVALGSMTRTVRRLEELGLITKGRDAQDRRKAVFTLTDQGRAAVTASRKHREDWLTSRLAPWTR